jgi:hypothetical protein
MLLQAVVPVFQRVAFWASIPLPLVIAGTLVTNVVAAQPLLVVVLTLLNIVCAILGHNYSPGA